MWFICTIRTKLVYTGKYLSDFDKLKFLNPRRFLLRSIKQFLGRPEHTFCIPFRKYLRNYLTQMVVIPVQKVTLNIKIVQTNLVR